VERPDDPPELVGVNSPVEPVGLVEVLRDVRLFPVEGRWEYRDEFHRLLLEAR